MINVLIADDHQIMLDGLKAILNKEPDLDVVGTAHNGIEVLDLLKSTKVDVLLLDIQMPEMDGIETIGHVASLYPKTKILMLTTNDEGSIITDLFSKGAMGYLLKNSAQETLIKGIKDAHQGHKVLSPHLTEKMLESLTRPKPSSDETPQITNRELDVLKLIAKGLTTQQIADDLFVSTNTVATHKRNLFVKMEVNNSAGMIKKAMDWGLI
ncbi:MAG: response regulator transcription factor [Schleiferiaceae bacterium]|nr:response regulator transcription factor [Schleiferiaceae bacterium]